MKLYLATAIAMIAGPTFAQHSSGDEACEAVVPQMTQFVAMIPQLDASFLTLYGEFSSEDKERFAEGREMSSELSTVAKDYRAAFLKACFGD